MIFLSISTFAAGALLVVGLALGVILGNTLIFFRSKTEPVISSLETDISLIDELIEGRYITTEQAEAMVKGYGNDNFSLTDSEKTKSIFFSKGYLESYIREMKKITRKNRLDVRVSGIRMFFARHMSEATLPDSDHKVGQATLILYPTFTEGTEEISFDPKLSSRGNIFRVGEMMQGPSPKQKTTKKPQKVNLKSIGSGSASDRAQTSPPRHP